MVHRKKKFILTIAGFDPSGKAGIIKDAQTIYALGADCVAAVTALTIQDSSKAFAYKAVPTSFFAQTLYRLLSEDRPNAVKIGMVPTISCANTIARMLSSIEVPIVYDPVVATTDGFALMNSGEEDRIFDTICKISTIITPNLNELKFFKTAQCIANKPIVLKGGHRSGDIVTDYLFSSGMGETLVSQGTYGKHRRKRVNKIIRGIGCAFSSAMAVFLGQGCSLEEAFEKTEIFMDSIWEQQELSSLMPSP